MCSIIHWSDYNGSNIETNKKTNFILSDENYMSGDKKFKLVNNYT